MPCKFCKTEKTKLMFVMFFEYPATTIYHTHTEYFCPDCLQIIQDSIQKQKWFKPAKCDCCHAERSDVNTKIYHIDGVGTKIVCTSCLAVLIRAISANDTWISKEAMIECGIHERR